MAGGGLVGFRDGAGGGVFEGDGGGHFGGWFRLGEESVEVEVEVEWECYIFIACSQQLSRFMWDVGSLWRTWLAMHIQVIVVLRVTF